MKSYKDLDIYNLSFQLAMKIHEISLRFLVYSLASCDETKLHLDFVHKAGYVNDDLYQLLNRENDELGRKINKFIKFVETDWKE